MGSWPGKLMPFQGVLGALTPRAGVGSQRPLDDLSSQEEVWVLVPIFLVLFTWPPWTTLSGWLSKSWTWPWGQGTRRRETWAWSTETMGVFPKHSLGDLNFDLSLSLWKWFLNFWLLEDSDSTLFMQPQFIRAPLSSRLPRTTVPNYLGCWNQQKAPGCYGEASVTFLGVLDIP